jgi:hypothetical protein
VKRFKCILSTLWLFIFTFLTASANVQEKGPDSLLVRMDSVEISLLTCGPGPEIYSLYGHTAILIHAPSLSTDCVVNYGMFSFRQKFFILRFIFGLTDYEMGITTYEQFLDEYRQEGRWVRKQTLNLTRQDKWNIIQAINENYQPEYRVYRYNYFYDNCTTRARDILVNNIHGKVEYAPRSANGFTYRSMTHQWNEQHRWARFGNDLLLGVKADAHTNLAEQQFLPDYLRIDFDQAKVINLSGKSRKLVTSDIYIIAPSRTGALCHDIWQTLTPRLLALLVAILIIGLTCVEKWTRRYFWTLDLGLMLADGLAGLILFAMIFSQHPTVSLNFQILLLTPLNLVFLHPTLKHLRKGNNYWWAKVWMICLIMFLLLGFVQSYAEGMIFLALSLLIRYSVILICNTQKKK